MLSPRASAKALGLFGGSEGLLGCFQILGIGIFPAEQYGTGSDLNPIPSSWICSSYFVSEIPSLLWVEHFPQNSHVEVSVLQNEMLFGNRVVAGVIVKLR